MNRANFNVSDAPSFVFGLIGGLVVLFIIALAVTP